MDAVKVVYLGDGQETTGHLVITFEVTSQILFMSPKTEL